MKNEKNRKAKRTQEKKALQNEKEKNSSIFLQIHQNPN